MPKPSLPKRSNATLPPAEKLAALVRIPTISRYDPAAEMIRGTGPFVAAFLVYLVTLGMNFFVSSASAKAFLMMPILIPLADIVGLTRQTVVFAFDLGDGFSNIAYPTNALLLIALSFTAVGWGTWIRWTWKAQAIIFVVSMGFLAAAVAGGYGPF